MKSVLISIQPYWAFLIIAKTMGWNIAKEKTVEVRKNYPKDKDWDKVTKIYCSKDKKSFTKIPKEYQPLMEHFLGKVIGEFVCDKLVWVVAHPSIFAGHDLFYKQAIEDACLTQDEVEKYSGGKDVYGWHISDLVIYDKPRELSEFFKACDKPKGTDCSVCIDHRENKCKSIARPPQSWCYVESEE